MRDTGRPDDCLFTRRRDGATLTVFTDVDCTYYESFYTKMPEALVAKGIEVRYLAYPRGGEAAGSYEKMISVWCSQDRHKSLTAGKKWTKSPRS